MNTKTAFAVIFSLIVTVTLILAFTIYTLNSNGNTDIEKYRADEIQKIKQSLKDYVEFAYAKVEATHKSAMDKADLERNYGPRLKSVIDVAETILKSKAEAVNKGELTLSEAQEQAAAEIKKIRYDNGSGYVWITDTTLPYPKMIMDPLTPSLDGLVLDDSKYNCALGKDQNLFSVAVEICQAHGKGFVDYLWPKKIQETVVPDVPKLAYMRLFQEWDWILGTAIYVDEAINDAIDESKTDIRRMKYNNGTGSFWINNATNLILEPSTQDAQILESKIKDFVDICDTQNGSGFLKDSWSKKGSIEETLSYVKLYRPLGWIIGTSVYLDSLDKAVAEKKASIDEQNNILILKIVSVSFLIVFLISGLIYLVIRYFANTNPVTEPTPVVEPEPVSVLNAEDESITPEIPVLTPAPEHGTVRTDDCIKMVQEISKTLIAEHAKLLATVIQPAEGAQKVEISQELKQLANKTEQTIEEVKKKVEANQQPSSADKTTEKVMGNLNQMLGE